MYEERRIYTTESRTEYVPVSPIQCCSPSPDLDYVRTLPGMLKCLVIILNLLCFLCISVGGPGYYAGIGWATFVSVFGFTVSLLLLIVYICRVVDNLHQFPWILSEMVFCFAWTIFYFIAACVLGVASATYRGTFAWAVATFFAFSAMCAYGLDCYLKFLVCFYENEGKELKGWKNDEKATSSGQHYGPRGRVDDL